MAPSPFPPRTTRAKFRCTGIHFTQGYARTPEFEALMAEHGYQEARRIAGEQGVEECRTFDQPRVELIPVTPADTGASAEDASFWSATPAGRIEMTITNPDAAETFELGKSYYVDFTPAED